MKKSAEKKGMDELEAVEKATQTTIETGYLVDYLKKINAEAKAMILTEFDEKGYEQTIREEGYADGEKAGREEERKNTEEERKRADAEKSRADEAVEAMGTYPLSGVVKLGDSRLHIRTLVIHQCLLQ